MVLFWQAGPRFSWSLARESKIVEQPKAIRVMAHCKMGVCVRSQRLRHPLLLPSQKLGSRGSPALVHPSAVATFSNPKPPNPRPFALSLRPQWQHPFSSNSSGEPLLRPCESSHRSPDNPISLPKTQSREPIPLQPLPILIFQTGEQAGGPLLPATTFRYTHHFPSSSIQHPSRCLELSKPMPS